MDEKKLKKGTIKMLMEYYCYNTAEERVNMSTAEAFRWLTETQQLYKRVIGIKKMRKIGKLAASLGWQCRT